MIGEEERGGEGESEVGEEGKASKPRVRSKHQDAASSEPRTFHCNLYRI